MQQIDQSTLARLQEFENDHKFYDALQFYHTKVTRCFRVKNSNEGAIPLVKYGINYFLRERQYQCAIDIATQYIDCLSKNNAALTETVFELLAGTIAEFARIAASESRAENTQQSQLLNDARGKCVDLAILWTKLSSSTEQEKKYGNTRFHSVLADAFLDAKELDLARNHFLLSDNAAGFAKYLQLEYTNLINTYGKIEYASDVIIVEAVQQVLCLDRFPFSVALFRAYTEPSVYPFRQPLLNFQHILFDVIETENKPQFSELTETYQSELKRSPSFVGYLSRIGKIYFGIRSSQCLGAGLGGLFSSLIGGQKEEETATSHITSRTPVRQQPSSVPFSIPTPFAIPAHPTLEPAAPSPKMEVEEDLD
ncbi:unnamed protein product [Caenorhabditis sp. 36 PRJEB53466]|nr:unnamed protein product [Caenorhabditis sp. 36 PRJEB53466]